MNILKNIFGDKADWVPSVHIPVKDRFARLTVILYALAVANNRFEYGKLINELLEGNEKAKEANCKGFSAVFGLPDGYFIMSPLKAILSDGLGEDAPLSALAELRIGNDFLATKYLSLFGSTSIGNEPEDGVVYTLSGDHVREIVKSF